MGEQEWLRGFTIALSALASWRVDTIYDAVVNESGEADALIQQAQKDGAMRWSGLSGYVRRQPAARRET